MKTEWIQGTPKNWQALQPHPLSALVEFGIGIDVDGLAQHMNQHGYDHDEAIVLHEGLILDGRHKHAACVKAGITPSFKKFIGKNAMAYVAKKIFRQHLTTSQRAMMAASVAKLPAGRPAEKVQNCTINSGQEESVELTTPTVEEAARALNVSPRSVKDARIVTEQGTPKEQAAVRDGTTTVSAAARRIKPPLKKRVTSEPARDPGDDSEAEAENAAARRRSGKAAFKDKVIEDDFGALVRDLTKREDAWGKHQELESCRGHLRNAHAAWKRWQEVTA